MEKKLAKLFDFHRFEKNKELEKEIQDTESRYLEKLELSEDELEMVSAAGVNQVDLKVFGLDEESLKEQAIEQLNQMADSLNPFKKGN